MSKLKLGIACSAENRDLYLGKEDLARLAKIADVVIEEYDVPSDWVNIPVDPQVEAKFARFAENLEVLIVFHGGPRVTKPIFDAAKKLKFVGELEGDRFAGRIDVQAAKEAGVVVVDTTHSSSWPVSEWALALALMGLREHARFRDIIAGKAMSHHDYRTKPPARELTGKSVGMIGFGHIGWRLREFLVPFRNEILAYDPYAPRELADALDINFASLEKVMTCDVVICLAPDTAKTRDMIAKAEKNDAWFGLDAHNPEPIAVDSPLRQMRNVFLSPHIGGMTVEAQPRFFTLMVEELERWHAGAEPRAQITDRVVAGRSGK
jgi:phosphoglycerate dehydrogenase-like enzyme